jgi:hypothetical protein
MSATRG